MWKLDLAIGILFVMIIFQIWINYHPLTPIPAPIVYEKQVMYEFPIRNDTVTITWVYKENGVRTKLDEVWAQYGAIGVSYPEGNKCTVYAFEPKFVGDSYERVLGHELLHCFRGQFHTQ